MIMLVSLGMILQRVMRLKLLYLTIAYIEQNVCIMVSITIPLSDVRKRCALFMVHSYSLIYYDARTVWFHRSANLNKVSSVLVNGWFESLSAFGGAQCLYSLKKKVKTDLLYCWLSVIRVRFRCISLS